MIYVNQSNAKALGGKLHSEQKVKYTKDITNHSTTDEQRGKKFVPEKQEKRINKHYILVMRVIQFFNRNM